MSTHSDALICDLEVTPTHSDALICDLEVTPTHSDALICDPEVMPTHSDALICDSEVIPTHSNALIYDPEVIPTHPNAPICDLEAMSTHSDAVIGPFRVVSAHLGAGFERKESVSIRAMNDPILPAPPLPAASVFFALDDPTRWQMVRALAGGARMSIVELAKIAGTPPDQAAKHLARLRDAGVLVRTRREADTRQWDHEIPAAYRQADAAGRLALDFGSVLLRL